MCQHDHPVKPHQRMGEALEHGEQHTRDHARWSRRDFLATGALAAGFQFLLGNTPVKAFGSHPLLSMLRSIETDRVLVLIQLNGGNDGLNTVIPVSNDIYYQRRPTIAIQKVNSLLLNPDVGLNPGLAALEQMWGDGHMNISSTALFERLASEGKAYETEGLPGTTWGLEMAWVRGLANQSYTYAGAVTAFYDDLKYQGLSDKVTAMTFSEFGRRVSENGSNGTDHGTSAPMMIFGGGIKGGFTGAAPDLGNLDNSNNLRFETDYRQVYATLMSDWFGVPSDIANQVFDASFGKLDLVNTPLSTRLGDDPTLPGSFTLRQNYPNPFNPSTVISYTLPQSRHVSLRVYDMNGRLVRSLVDQQQAVGSYEIMFEAQDLASGVYVYTLDMGGQRKSLKMTFLK